VPKVYVVLGLGALYFFLVFFNIGANFLINTIGFAIPAYYSLDALFSHGSADDTQWLTYWVVYAFLTFFESAVNAVYWFPFYYTFKFVLVLWMALPQTRYAPPNYEYYIVYLLIRAIAVLKSSSARSSSQSSPVTSLTELLAPPPTSALLLRRHSRSLILSATIFDKVCDMAFMRLRTVHVSH
jgi:receptor expression-enhancing protein 5/6